MDLWKRISGPQLDFYFLHADGPLTAGVSEYRPKGDVDQDGVAAEV